MKTSQLFFATIFISIFFGSINLFGNNLMDTKTIIKAPNNQYQISFDNHNHKLVFSNESSKLEELTTEGCVILNAIFSNNSKFGIILASGININILGRNWRGKCFLEIKQPINLLIYDMETLEKKEQIDNIVLAKYQTENNQIEIITQEDGNLLFSLNEL